MAAQLHDGPSVSQIPWSASLQTLADQFGERIAISDAADRFLTYDDLCAQAHGLAHTLLARLGQLDGKPVATLLPNSVTAVWSSYGLRMTGAAEVPVGWSSTPDETAWCAHLAGFTHVLTLSLRADEVRRIGLEPICLDTLDLPSDRRTLPAVTDHHPGRILFTSGTTGKPKGVLYSHGRRWAGEQLLKATLPFIPRPGDKIILMTPFVHGSSLLTYAWCDFGAHVVLLDGVRHEDLARVLPDPSVRAVFAPPTVLAKITTLFEDQTFEHVQCVFTGTQPLTQSVYRRASAMFGPVVRITYGKSECVNPITVLSPEQTRTYYEADTVPPGACVGFPAPGVEIHIEHASASESTESEADHDADGEIWLRARQMSLGMITEAGFAPHQPDGWHQTGDLGHFDAQGRLVLTGRVADVIKTGGYRVNPDEIEALLTGWSSAMQISVTSLPSDYWGEIIIAVAESPEADWHDKVAQRVSELSKHKRPRLLVTLDALPRNPQGKVNRRHVRARVLEHYELQDGPYPSLTVRQGRA